MKRFRRAGTKITRTKIRSAMLSDKTMVKMSLDVQSILTISFVGAATEASTSIPLSFIDGTGFNVQNFPSSLLNWANFYGAFRVLGSKIRTEFFPMTQAATANGNVPLTCAVFPSSKWIVGTGNASTNVYSQAYVKYRTLGAYGTAGTPTNHTLSNYMSSKKMFGQRVTQDGDFQQSFTYSGISPNTATTLVNPVETADWIIFIQTGDVAAPAASDIKVLVVSRVTYYVSLEDRLQQPQTYGPSV